jgi:hypothetical protein
MNCEIIDFSAARLSAKRVDEIEASTRAVVAGPIFVRRRERPLPEPLTETCKSQRLRDARKDAWIGIPPSNLRKAAELRMRTGFPRATAKAGCRSSIHGVRRS